MAIRFSRLIRRQLSFIVAVCIIAIITMVLSSYSTPQTYNFYTAVPVTKTLTVVPNQAYRAYPELNPTATTTTTTIPLPDLSGIDFVQLARLSYGMCGEYYQTAITAGWKPEDWPQLRKIMYRESRCLPDACSQSDSGRVCRDWGLMQINEYSWRRHIIAQGYKMADMHDPFLNLKFARWIYELEVSNGGTGWGAWKLPAKS